MTQRNRISGHHADHRHKHWHSDIAKNHASRFATNLINIGFQNATLKALPDKQHHFKLEHHRVVPILFAPILFAPILFAPILFAPIPSVAALVSAKPVPYQDSQHRRSQHRYSNPIAPSVVIADTS
jgi:hypothetical protein